MLATADGRIAGSVSGGCVEGAVFEEISRAMATGLSRLVRYGITDAQAADVGLACGGAIDVLAEPLVRPEVEAAALEAPGPGFLARVVITPLPVVTPAAAGPQGRTGDGTPPSPTLVAWEDGRLDGSLGDQELDRELVRLSLESLARGASRTVDLGGRALFVESFQARPRLFIVGAGQVAIPLVAMAHVLGYETVVVDGRAAFATRERFPEADRLIVAWPDEAAGEVGLGPNDSVVVLSHDPKFDDPAVLAAFARGCRYVGVIGSRRTQADRRRRLLAAGLGPEGLAALSSPIGLDLGGRSPAETALSIMAEVVACRFGGSGLRLSETQAVPAEAAAVSQGVSPQAELSGESGTVRTR